jgi:cytidylate kinase
MKPNLINGDDHEEVAAISEDVNEIEKAILAEVKHLLPPEAECILEKRLVTWLY